MFACAAAAPTSVGAATAAAGAAAVPAAVRAVPAAVLRSGVGQRPWLSPTGGRW